MAMVAAILIGFDSNEPDSVADPTCSFDWSISGLFGRVSFRGHYFPSLQSEKFCVYCFLPVRGEPQTAPLQRIAPGTPQPLCSLCLGPPERLPARPIHHLDTRQTRFFSHSE